MRSLVGAAIADDFDDDAPPPPKRRAKPRAKGPKVTRAKSGRGRGNATARWADAMRSTVRRGLFWSLVLAGFFAVVAIAGLFSGGHVSGALRWTQGAFDGAMVSAGLTVQQVTLEGRAQAARGDIARMLDIKIGGPMLYVDVDEARARLEALPWVKSAEVRRIWPNRIVVRINERRPVAVWQHDGRLVLIDGQGQPIAGENVSRFEELPLVVGKGAAQSVNSLLALVATQPKLKSRVKVAQRVGERRWNLRLDNDVEVRLPEEGAEAALAELVRLDREEEILARDIKAIDLRFPDRFIVKLPPNSPVISPRGGRET